MHTQTIIKGHRNPLSHAGAGGLGWRSHASCKKTLTSDNVHSRVVCDVFHFPFKVIVRENISFSDKQCNKKPTHCPLHSTWEICPCPKHPEPTLGRYFLMTVWESKDKVMTGNGVLCSSGPALCQTERYYIKTKSPDSLQSPRCLVYYPWNMQSRIPWKQVLVWMV